MFRLMLNKVCERSRLRSKWINKISYLIKPHHGAVCNVSAVQHRVFQGRNHITGNDIRGSRQSPIAIDMNTHSFDVDMNRNPITITYSPESNLQMQNNGYTLVMHTTQESIIRGGPLKNAYKLIQFHLHWGCSNERGSEHTLNGHAYSGELHMVHWNMDKYSRFEDAIENPDGLAVLGAMIEIGEENSSFKAITDQINNVLNSGSECYISKTFDPSSLLPLNCAKYWTYPGSLTTPEFNESVTWILFYDPIVISQLQMDALRNMKNSEGKCMCDNFRDVMPLNGRCIRSSFTQK